MPPTIWRRSGCEWGHAHATRWSSRPVPASSFESDNPEIVGNVMVCLCAQTGYLLDQQIRELEQAFLREGGIRERMTRARLDARGEPQPAAAPGCPVRGKTMRQRTARQGPNAGQPFWGCIGYPDCRGTRKL